MMKHRFLFICFLIGFSSIVRGQSSVPDNLALSFHNQLAVFPQEKIYLHTDKPYYLSGERIWFRAHVADAANHIPAIASRYVYVELIHPLDTVLTRVKILQDEAGAYHGHLSIPDDAPEGDYAIRAYTAFMRNLAEDYFCTKTVRIGDPQARAIHTDTKFVFDPERRGRIHATFRFSQVGSGTPLVPKSVKVSVNNGREMTLQVEDDGTASFNFDIQAPSNSPKGGGQSPSFGWVRGGIILLEVTAFEYPYRQFIRIPAPDDDFDVSFYPEGGSLMQGAFGRIAFKAMKSNGQATDIMGVIYDHTGTEITSIASDHLGMGSFRLIAEKGKTYYAVCENDKGQSKRFNLPAAASRGYSLSVSQTGSNINITTLGPAEAVQTGELYLLAHTRGMVHFAIPWNNEINLASIKTDQLPSGVVHFILFDAGCNPVSERLVFINNPDDQAQVNYRPDQENFARRSLVKNQVMITGSDGEPLTGSFSVSVTSDREVTQDTTSNILTHLLLASDLRGHIENPAYYFQNTPSSSLALDLLMLTQGWRRYDIAELAQGRFSEPAMPLEAGAEISGTVQSLLLGRPAENVDVNVMSLNGDYSEVTTTDKDGRFYLPGCDLPEKTQFIVSVVPRRRMTRMDLILDRETYPERTLSIVPAAEVDRSRFVRYVEKAELIFTEENGMRVNYLPEVIVTAPRKSLKNESMYYDVNMLSPSSVITEEKIERLGTDLVMLLNTVPGVRASRNNGQLVVTVRGNSILSGEGKPLLLIDDIAMPREAAFDILDMIDIFNVAQIDILKGGEAARFGILGLSGAISITTKSRTNPFNQELPQYHIRTYAPLGYQQPVEFYAPKYDTPAARNAQTPDLRTTIHWQPVVQTDDTGAASFEFYTADEQTSYTVVIEGITDDGMVIRQERQLWKREDKF